MKWIGCVYFGLLLAGTPVAFGREWNDSTGRYRVEASFVKLEGNLVYLRRSDSTTVQVPLEKLCKADQAYARQNSAPIGQDLQIAPVDTNHSARASIVPVALQTAPNDGAPTQSVAPSMPMEGSCPEPAYRYKCSQATFYIVGDTGLAEYYFREPKVRYSGYNGVPFHNVEHLVRVKQIPSSSTHCRWVLLEAFGGAPYVTEFALDMIPENGNKFAIWYKDHRGWWSFFDWAERFDFVRPGYGRDPKVASISAR